MSSASFRAAAVLVMIMLIATGSTPVATAQQADHLDRVLQAGLLRIATDADNPPNSAAADGRLSGFDVDVGLRIAQRLGVNAEFDTPSWPLVEAGSWGGRWDLNVGSMITTSAREEVIDFTRPYHYVTALMTAHADLGYQAVADLAGQAICTAEDSAFAAWVEGSLDLGELTPPTPPPADAVLWPASSTRGCPEAWGRGEIDFQGWIAPEPDVAEAIADGLPVVALGEPVFQVPMAVAFDRQVDDNDSLVAAVDGIVADMRADGTLAELSLKWFGEDRTTPLSEAPEASS